MEDWSDYQFLSGPNGWSGATSFDDADADVVFRIATTTLTVSREPEENRVGIEDRLLDVAESEPGVDVVLFGETITGWYYEGETDAEDVAYQQSIAEPIPGPTTDRVASLASELDLLVAFGIAEEGGDGLLYNALVLVGPDGQVLAVHRKVLPVHSDLIESLDAPYTAGDEPTVVTIDGVPFGLLICNDMHSLRVAETFTDRGVAVVLSANADPTPAVEVGGWSPVPPIFDAWFVVANRHGDEGTLSYPGAASIADPAGMVRASLNGDGWVASTVGVYQ